MRTRSFASLTLFVVAAVPLLASPALAQPAVPPTQPPAGEAPPAPAQPAEGTTPPADGTVATESSPIAPETGPAVLEPPPAPQLVVPVQPAPVSSSVDTTAFLVPTGQHPVTPEAAAPSWIETAEYRVFVDSYYGMNWNLPKPQIGPQAEVRAYDLANGFALAWAGGDLSVPAAPVGGTLSLRFGPSAVRYSGCISGQVPCDGDNGLTNVKQAFGSVRPVKGLTLDLGKFDTSFGAEVADSQDNMNYTRGVLYWLGQPLFHTGFRLEYEATKQLSATLLVVNGWNNSVDNNVGKTFGLQGKYASRNEKVSVALGYLGGPEHDDTDTLTCADGQRFDPNLGCVASPGTAGNTYAVDRADSNTSGWRHFVDLVVGINPNKDFAILANASFGQDNPRDPAKSSNFVSVSWWGAMLGARYDLGALGVGARGEYFGDKDGFAIPRAKGTQPNADGAMLVTGTLTLDADIGPNLILKLDNRLDWADLKIFQSGIRTAEGSQFTSTLGLVATVP